MSKNIYNATVTGKIQISPENVVLRVRTDEPRDHFKPGQYTKIGLLASEKRCQSSAMTISDNAAGDELIIRPYHIASATDDEVQEFEFYISLVRAGELSPRLFELKRGRRIWVDEDVYGVFNLEDVPEGNDIVLIATGTGLAPYISFLRSNLKNHTNRKIAVIHSGKDFSDLAYQSELELIQNNFPNFFYFPTILEKDDSWRGYTGDVVNLINFDILQDKAKIEISPNKTHVFLCGNPEMIKKVTEFFGKFGFDTDTENSKGQIHKENCFYLSTK